MSEFLFKCVRVFSIAILTVVVTCTSFMAGFGTSYLIVPKPAVVEPTTEEERAFQVFWEAWRILEEEFYGEIPGPKEMTYGAIRGVLRTLEDDVVFIEPDRARLFAEDITGTYEGIGTVVRMRKDGKLLIVHPFEGSPAEKAGLLPGDLILKVDGTSLEGMSVMEAIFLIRGPEGTTVQLLIEREGKTFEVEIVRARIEIPVVDYDVIDEDIAYIWLWGFSTPVAGKIKVALRELLAKEPKGLILDLRNNPGGLLDVSIEVASQFIGEGIILTERLKDGQVREYKARPGGLALEIPLVVLINGGTASASEIVAGAIQDAGRGILIGEPTMGKGSIQHPYTLSDGSELRVTYAYWFTPKGRAIHKEGLTPDILIRLTPEDRKAGRDPQLERAIEYLKKGR
jgi:carboxyl-terminal processing protease